MKKLETENTIKNVVIKEKEGILPSQLDEIRDIIQRRGLDSCFIKYSSFNHIKDNDFQRLKHDYVQASIALRAWLNMDNYEQKFIR